MCYCILAIYTHSICYSRTLIFSNALPVLEGVLLEFNFYMHLKSYYSFVGIHFSSWGYDRILLLLRELNTSKRKSIHSYIVLKMVDTIRPNRSCWVSDLIFTNEKSCSSWYEWMELNLYLLIIFNQYFALKRPFQAMCKWIKILKC